MFHCCAAMSVVRDNHTISRKSDAGQVEILSSFSSYANCDTIYSWKGEMCIRDRANYQAEAEAIREQIPDALITTNFMGAYKPLDYKKWAASLDVISWEDVYKRQVSESVLTVLVCVVKDTAEQLSVGLGGDDFRYFLFVELL